MTKEVLSDHIDYVQARAEEMDKLLIKGNPAEKGYKETIDAYNKWVDRYEEMITRLEHFEDVSIDEAKLEFEKEKLKVTSDLERDKQTASYEIERDRVDNETERLRLDREKFAYDVQHQKAQDIVDIIFKTADVGTKVAVPLIGGYFALKLAVLAYTKNGDLELRDGTIWALIKQLKL